VGLLYVILLRLVHVAASIGWAGGTFIFFFFVQPAGRALAPSGMEVVRHMIGKGRFSLFMNWMGTLTVVSGLLLIWQSTRGHLGAWVGTGPGLGFALGSLAGVAMWLVGTLAVKPRAERMTALGAEIAAAGGPPSPPQAAEMQAIGQALGTLGKVNVALVSVSLILMATARYWLF
jgi:uncharacterized membrane protein